MNINLNRWKYPTILLFGIGVSTIGAWIYLISLNLLVLNMTGSPLAVAALYILGPLATLTTNVWAGSVIDRVNKRNLMVYLDIFRALLIFVLPYLNSLPFMFVLVFIINMGNSIFKPTSMTYIAKLIPTEQRKSYNALYSLINSGAFLIGPAIAGILFIVSTPVVAIQLNAIALFISGLITLLMPNIEKHTIVKSSDSKLSVELLKKDWKTVYHFSKNNVRTVVIYFLFSFVMVVMATALDSLEASFSKEVLHLSDSEYGFLVSIAGAGILVGASINTFIVNKLSTPTLIGLGSVVVSVGYLVYAFSESFFIAALGFFILASFIAFANTGFMTFYQTNVPTDVMGRIGSIYGVFEALLIMMATLSFGLVAQLISIRFIVITGSIVMLTVAVILNMYMFKSVKVKLSVGIKQ
ncbi:MFS transporter [Cytobacillus sp. FJAT-54145]|uniref:MFS transporter n=1 Tax=Cytobacillus spartinae TaxID=3299023 RepID=A0ABW6KFG5_9BACI